MIQIGQDALGGWAWMLFAGARMIECGQRLDSAEQAEEEAKAAFGRAKERGELDLPSSPLIDYPDGRPD